MVSEQVQKTAVWFRGVAYYPINVCLHCGGADDPESTKNWPEDKDGDRICPDCAKKEKSC